MSILSKGSLWVEVDVGTFIFTFTSVQLKKACCYADEAHIF